jgi:hypothetical protein
VFKVLNISDNQAAKPSKSQVYRLISLNLRSKEVRKTRKLSCTLQMSLGLFTSILSYCKITMLRMVRCKLFAVVPFSDFHQVLPSLGLTTFWETQSNVTRMNQALTELHGRPGPGNKLKRYCRSGSRKSGKFMVDRYEIDTK